MSHRAHGSPHDMRSPEASPNQSTRDLYDSQRYGSMHCTQIPQCKKQQRASPQSRAVKPKKVPWTDESALGRRGEPLLLPGKQQRHQPKNLPKTRLRKYQKNPLDPCRQACRAGYHGPNTCQVRRMKVSPTRCSLPFGRAFCLVKEGRFKLIYPGCWRSNRLAVVFAWVPLSPESQPTKQSPHWPLHSFPFVPSLHTPQTRNCSPNHILQHFQLLTLTSTIFLFSFARSLNISQ